MSFLCCDRSKQRKKGDLHEWRSLRHYFYTPNNYPQGYPHYSPSYQQPSLDIHMFINIFLLFVHKF